MCTTLTSEIKLMDIKTNKVFYDKLSYIYLQMPNFTKKVSELKTQTDKWLFAIKNLHNLDDKPEVLSGVFQKFFEEAQISNYTQKEIKAYEQSLKYYRDLKNSIDTARDEGREEGREEERKKQSALKSKTIIKALKKGKLSVREIAELFEVSIEFVKTFKA